MSLIVTQTILNVTRTSLLSFGITRTIHFIVLLKPISCYFTKPSLDIKKTLVSYITLYFIIRQTSLMILQNPISCYMHFTSQSLLITYAPPLLLCKHVFCYVICYYTTPSPVMLQNHLLLFHKPVTCCFTNQYLINS